MPRHTYERFSTVATARILASMGAMVDAIRAERAAEVWANRDRTPKAQPDVCVTCGQPRIQESREKPCQES